MKPKTLKWINPRPEFWLSSEDIPQVLYRIHKVEPFVFGLFFYHGYAREYEDAFIGKNASETELMELAQNHWNDYVTKNFLEE